MSPEAFLRMIDDGLATMAAVIGPAPDRSDAARVLIHAICGQESDHRFRLQQGGPARFYAMFEIEAVVNLMQHQRTATWIQAVCASLDIPSDAKTIHQAMAWNDPIGITLTRMNLYLRPVPLPAVGDQTGAWQFYLKTWAPGKPDESRWPAYYHAAMTAVTRKATLA